MVTQSLPRGQIYIDISIEMKTYYKKKKKIRELTAP